MIKCVFVLLVVLFNYHTQFISYFLFIYCFYKQLAAQQGLGLAFQGWSEQAIDFAPTYKYDVESTVYDTSEKRRAPAYCDRVLYMGIY